MQISFLKIELSSFERDRVVGYILRDRFTMSSPMSSDDDPHTTLQLLIPAASRPTAGLHYLVNRVAESVRQGGRRDIMAVNFPLPH